MAILLRTLTEKSKLQEGQHSGFTVGWVIRLDELSYLRSMYFTKSMISFTDEVLDKIKIAERYRIEKPGKNPNLVNIVNNSVWRNLSTEEKRKYRNKKDKKIQISKDIKSSMARAVLKSRKPKK